MGIRKRTLREVFAFKTDTTGTEVSCGTSSAVVLNPNETRRFANLVNDSSAIIYLRLGQTAGTNKGIRLNASGGSFQIDATNMYTGTVSAICASANKTLLAVEG